MKNFCNIQPLVDKKGIRHDMWDGALWKTSRAGGSAGKRGDHGRGGAGLWDRQLGSCGWGAVVGGWDFAVDGLRLGHGELEIGGWDFAGRGACAMSIGDLRVGGRGEAWGRRVRFGAEGWGLRLAVCGLGLESAIRALALAAWGWGVIRATGVWAPGRSFGRTELCGFAWGSQFWEDGSLRFCLGAAVWTP